MVQRLASHARRNVVAYLALVVALAAAGGVAYSSIPDAQGVIHGCYDNANGALRVIDTDASGVCRGGETALDWNQQGQPGLTGHTGPTGTPRRGADLRQVCVRARGAAQPGTGEDDRHAQRPGRLLRDLRQGRGIADRAGVLVRARYRRHLLQPAPQRAQAGVDRLRMRDPGGRFERPGARQPDRGCQLALRRWRPSAPSCCTRSRVPEQRSVSAASSTAEASGRCASRTPA